MKLLRRIVFVVVMLCLAFAGAVLTKAWLQGNRAAGFTAVLCLLLVGVNAGKFFTDDDWP